MLYKRKDSAYWWVKLKNKGRQVRKSTRTKDRAQARLFEVNLRKSLRSIREPINVGICYLYIIGIADSISPVKIGISKRPADRKITLQISHYEKLVLYSTIKFRNTKAAAAAEAKAHEIFRDVHIRGEWFEMDAHTAEETILRLVADDHPV